MGEDNKEIKPHLIAPGEGTASACQGRVKYHCRHCQHWNQGNQSGKFKGKTKEIKFDTFNNTGLHDAAQFSKFLKNIANHLQLIHGNDVSEAVRNMVAIKNRYSPCTTRQIIW